MIPVPAGVRMWLATGHTDMRNYAAAMIMRSRWRRRPGAAGAGDVETRSP